MAHDAPHPRARHKTCRTYSSRHFPRKKGPKNHLEKHVNAVRLRVVPRLGLPCKGALSVLEHSLTNDFGDSLFFSINRFSAVAGSPLDLDIRIATESSPEVALRDSSKRGTSLFDLSAWNTDDRAPSSLRGKVNYTRPRLICLRASRMSGSLELASASALDA